MSVLHVLQISCAALCQVTAVCIACSDGLKNASGSVGYIWLEILGEFDSCESLPVAKYPVALQTYCYLNLWQGK